MRRLATLAMTLACVGLLGVACARAPSPSGLAEANAPTPSPLPATAAPTTNPPPTTPTTTDPQSTPSSSPAVAKPTGPTVTAKATTGDPERGRVLFQQKGCVLCHGDNAEGLVGPKIAGTTLSFAEVLHQVRNPRGTMQQFQPADISDAEVQDIYAHLQTLR